MKTGAAGRRRVAIYGTGRAGTEVARACGERSDVELVAVVSRNPQKSGLNAGDVMGLDGLDLPIHPTLEDAPAVDVLVHTGLGEPPEVAELLGAAAASGVSSVTVNGLIHPPTALGAAGADALDARARAGGARVVGTGVNPGFLLDVLPVIWTSMTSGGLVKARRISEIRDWGTGALEDEVRVGADPSRIEDNGALALDESVALIADAGGIAVERVDTEFAPEVARSRREYRGRVVEEGQVAGFRRRSVAVDRSGPRIDIEWRALFCLDPGLDACDVEASVEIDGENWIDARCGGHFLNDPYPATAARALNAIGPLLAKEPGLWRPDQLPVSA